MPSILVVASHRPGRNPSQRYRIEQFVPYWERHGARVEYAWLIDEEDDEAFYTQGRLIDKARILLKSIWRRAAHVRRARSFDLIFLQREALMIGSIRFERAFAATGVPMIYDFDDAIWHMDVSDANRRLKWLKDPGKTPRIMALATHVIAGNEYLAGFARAHNPHVEVIPTVIDTERYVPMAPAARPDGKVIIGWTGSYTSAGHLRLAIPVLLGLQREFGDRIGFRFISDRAIEVPGLHVENVRWSSATEPEDIAPIDIGIMPLPDTEWSRGKCGFKGLQCMAMGKAVVLADVGVNRAIIQDGVNGMLARNDAEWTDRLRQLITNADLRHRLGAEARRTVERHYSTLAWRDRYLELFAELTQHR